MARVTASSTNVAPNPLALRPRVLRTLLWLRWQLLKRNYAKSTGSIIGAVILLIFLIPFAALITVGMIYAFGYLHDKEPATGVNLLFYILAGIYLLWSLFPLLQFNLNEGLDITKLTLYPLSRPEIMASLLVATLFDIPTFGLAIVLVGIGISWAGSALQGVAIGAILLVAYISIISLSQLLLAALSGLLRSRRWRDISVVIYTLLGLSTSLFFQVYSRTANEGTAEGFVAAVRTDVSAWLQFLPPGMAARAITSVAANDVTGALLWSLALVVMGLIILWAWNAVLARSLATPEENGGGASVRRSRRAIASDNAPASATPQRSLLPIPVLAMATKDLRIFWRDPQYKRSLLSSLYFVGILLIPAVTSGKGVGAARTSTQYALVAALFLVLNFSIYAFGYEGPAVTTLAIFPVRPFHIFLGKNLAVLTLGLAEGAILLVVQTVVSGRPELLPVFAITLIAGLLAALGLGNALAVLLPLRVPRRGVGRQDENSGSGFLRGMLVAGSYLLAIILIAPISLAVILPQVLNNASLYFVALPLALLWGVVVYSGGTALATNLYYPRLTKIMEVVAPIG